MKQRNRLIMSVWAAVLIAASVNATADDKPGYAHHVGSKALNGLANVTTAMAEIPKNIINTTNASNIAYGFVGGTVKGLINFMGRTTIGFMDLVTAPIPTKPIIQPAYVWQDFNSDTTYGKVFRLQE